jgi:hypothetical protein
MADHVGPAELGVYLSDLQLTTSIPDLLLSRIPDNKLLTIHLPDLSNAPFVVR